VKFSLPRKSPDAALKLYPSFITLLMISFIISVVPPPMLKIRESR
jgi:hypothetical protein